MADATKDRPALRADAEARRLAREEASMGRDLERAYRAIDGQGARDASTVFVNHIATRTGRAFAVCSCCDRRSSSVACQDGQPCMWDLPRGWSCAPFPADFVHRDESVGSLYTCPACNKRLRAGETVQTVRGNATRRVLS